MVNTILSIIIFALSMFVLVIALIIGDNFHNKAGRFLEYSLMFSSFVIMICNFKLLIG